MRDFEAVQKTRSRVLSGLKILAKPDNTLLLVFKQYLEFSLV